MALAAGIMLIAGLTAAVLITRFPQPGTLASDAVGDHRNCALRYRLIRTPVPLEEAARRFDHAYRLLRGVPPDDIAAPGGTARVVDRHSCAYGARRFGHVVLQYRGHVVSLLVTAVDARPPITLADEAVPHVLGPSIQDQSVVSVTGSHHAVLLVGDLPVRELTQLADVISVPLARELSGPAAASARADGRCVTSSRPHAPHQSSRSPSPGIDPTQSCSYEQRMADAHTKRRISAPVSDAKPRGLLNSSGGVRLLRTVRP